MINIPDSIFPKDSAGNLLCPKCKKTLKLCDCPSGEPIKPKAIVSTVKPVIRIEKSGRSGKIVTVIERLTPSEVYLKDLAKNLKTKTGSGGTHYIKEGQGIVEIQGDHRKAIEQFFTKSH